MEVEARSPDGNPSPPGPPDRWGRLIRNAPRIPFFLVGLLYLRLHGVRCGRMVRSYRVYVRNRGEIRIGSHVSLNSFPNGRMHRTGLLTFFPEARIRIGDHCALNGTVVLCNERVTIEAHCMFGPGTVVCDNDSHRVALDVRERRKRADSAPIHIGPNVWVGMNALLLKGVTVGPNAIIAAGSVVTSDVPQNALAGGHPARVIRIMED